jgi:hypothetical protein
MVTRMYKTELQQAKEKLQDLLVQADELQVRIAKQKRVVAALVELTDIDDDSGAPEGLVGGITDACKTVLWSAERPLFPVAVRDRIKALGFPEQKNLLASVHTVLKRLAVAGDATEVYPAEGSGPAAYRRPTFGERIGAPGKLGYPNPTGTQKGSSGMPNPHGKNLAEMLRETPKKK